MNINWSNELQALDRVEPTRDLWKDAIARAAEPRRQAHLDLRERSWLRPRRRRIVALGVALGISGLAAVVVVALGAISAGPAYAVTTNPDGTITITLSQFSALPALNQELVQEGLPLRAVPATADCPFNPSQGLPTGPRGPGLAPTDTITIGTSEIASEGGVGVIGVSQAATPGRLLMMEAGVPADAVPSCINSAAFGPP
jgi:hypothetical protein